jgi:hypothetical protein
MARLQKSLLTLLHLVLVTFAATFVQTVPAATVHAKSAAGLPGTSLAAADTASGTTSSSQDDGSDDDDDDDDGEDQQ